MTKTPLSSESSGIEKLTHVQNKICMMWATPELDGYINHLLTDSRDGQRKGFPVEVTAELLFLAELNKMVRAIDMARRLKIPLREAYEKVDHQDRGSQLGDPNDSLSGRDQFGREEKELGISSRPVRKTEPKEGVTATFGKGIFALLTSKAVIFLLLLFIAYKFLAPYFFMK